MSRTLPEASAPIFEKKDHKEEVFSVPDGRKPGSRFFFERLGAGRSRRLDFCPQQSSLGGCLLGRKAFAWKALILRGKDVFGKVSCLTGLMALQHLLFCRLGKISKILQQRLGVHRMLPDASALA